MLNCTTVIVLFGKALLHDLRKGQIMKDICTTTNNSSPKVNNRRVKSRRYIYTKCGTNAFRSCQSVECVVNTSWPMAIWGIEKRGKQVSGIEKPWASKHTTQACLQDGDYHLLHRALVHHAVIRHCRMTFKLRATFGRSCWRDERSADSTLSYAQHRAWCPKFKVYEI